MNTAHAILRFGCLRLLVALWIALGESGVVAADDLLVAPGSTWSYLDDGSDQGSAWSQIGFDDQSWSAGPAQLGYGDGDEATVVSYGPNASNKYITTYFRRTFTAGNPAGYLSASLNLLRDDGAVVYLNGLEIMRSNLPPGPITYTTRASTAVGGASEDTFIPLRFDPALLQPGPNLLAVEIHQSSPLSSDISFDLGLIGETTLRTIRGPYLQLGTDTGISIHWRTNAACDSEVRFGSAPGSLTQSVSDPAVDTEHALRLTGLSPETTYYYSVGSTSTVLSGGDPDHFFVTLPPPGEERPLRIWMLGDSGTADANARAVRDAYYGYTGATHTNLWLMLGDNAYNVGSDAEYQAAVFDTYPEMLKKSVLWSTRGNHETFAGTYYGIFELPAAGEAGGLPSGTEAYYSFDVANIHFVCLDSTGSSRLAGSAMATWLRADLAATDQRWIIAFWHHPPYSKGSHNSDTEIELVEMRSNLVPELEAGGVDLVFCGHSHSYERSYLMDGHYGLSSSFGAQHLKDPGDGRPSGDGAYVKATVPNAGAVYTVAGSSGRLSNGPLNHPAMLVSTLTLGSVVLDVNGDQLDVTFLGTGGGTGQVVDRFVLRSFEAGSLSGDSTTLSLGAGGVVAFSLDAGPVNAHRPYLLLGSLSGTAPGIPIGSIELPLVQDDYTIFSLWNANLGWFGNTSGLLDGSGTAQASLTLPSGLPPTFAGLTAYHAFMVYTSPRLRSADFASNAFPLTLLP